MTHHDPGHWSGMRYHMPPMPTSGGPLDVGVGRQRVIVAVILGVSEFDLGAIGSEILRDRASVRKRSITHGRDPVGYAPSPKTVVIDLTAWRCGGHALQVLGGVADEVLDCRRRGSA